MARGAPAEIVPLLIAAGGNIEKADKWGRTPLLVQALLGRIGGIKALLAAGARIDVRNEDQATAIHLAASNGYVIALEVLWRMDGSSTPNSCRGCCSAKVFSPVPVADSCTATNGTLFPSLPGRAAGLSPTMGRAPRFPNLAGYAFR